MRISDGRVIWSASDLKKAAECEFAWVRSIDAKLGRIAAVDEPVDEMMQRAIDLGLSHEYRVLDEYREAFASGVIEVPAVNASETGAVAEAVALTEEALRSSAAVVYQGAFRDDDFIGFADFMVQTPEGWVVQDTKLARTARVTALMQLAAYVDQLHRLGVTTSPQVELILGTGERSVHAIDDLMPVFYLRRQRIRALIADREVGAERQAIAFNDDRGDLGVIACGRCATCEQEVIAHRDLLLVAGMRPVHRRRLREASIETIDQLANADTCPEGMNPDVFESLRLQARLQCESPAGISGATMAEEHPVPAYEVMMPAAFGALPRPDRGDIYFDFEGDPLHTEDNPAIWGLDYLFGWVNDDEQYTPLWAHSFADEKVALTTFLQTVGLMRQANPGMHIYHYAPYEPTHLANMAARHGVGEAEVDTLLADGVFVDLYPIVKRALRVGSRSYSIKKLEPLYMGDEVRTEDVQNGGDSIGRYVAARSLAAGGHSAESDEILQDLADYNKYDCVSTRRLRNWLVERAIEAGTAPAREQEPEEKAYAPSPQAIQLQGIASDHVAAGEDPEHVTAVKLAAAAIDYYPREAKTFWAEHFLRLREVLSTWESQRDVLAVDRNASTIEEDWDVPDGKRALRRVLRLTGTMSPGSTFKVGQRPLIYERPAPFLPARLSPRWLNVEHPATIIDVLDDAIIVEETAMGGQTWDELPVAVAPGTPPRAGAQQSAINAWAEKLLTAEAWDDDFEDPAWDLLLRRPPRMLEGSALETTPDQDKIDAIVADVVGLDHSYLAVQGPPGTGKTYVAAHVIERLVREKHYRIGVVAQSHDVVENVLDRVVAAGLDPLLVGKPPRDSTVTEASFTLVQRASVSTFLEKHRESGCVLGGTAWDFANEARVVRGALDLLVIDEAGQFSLASTIACSVAARNLLLLGDPQQLPQVSQGTHPEPVDTSALGWLMGDADVLPAEFGLFLEHTWRMHPKVAEAVSRLSYDGKLEAHPSTAARRIDGIEPGIHPVALKHRGNSSESPEETDEVVRIAQDLLGRTWHPGDGEHSRPLGHGDIIVVAPYNAQQQTILAALHSADLTGIRVGTVDKFQGQEAAVSILSLAASSPREAPRGLEFLLLENRINVAVSRAQYAAYVVYSPSLLDDLPYTPAGVARLSAFARLVGA